MLLKLCVVNQFWKGLLAAVGVGETNIYGASSVGPVCAGCFISTNLFNPHIHPMRTGNS